VDLDGTLWTDVRHTGLKTPSLLLTHDSAGSCDAFCARAATDFANVEASAKADHFAVAGAQHMNFSDVGLMWGPADKLALGSIDADRMNLITRDVVRSFLDVHLRDALPSTFAAATA